MIGRTGLNAFDTLELGIELAGVFNPSGEVVWWIFHREDYFYKASIEPFDEVVDKGVVGFGESCFGCS